MLKKIRRAAAMVVVLIFALALMPQIAGASEDLVFLCINDEIITGISSSSMPVRINNNTYIAVKYLLRIKPLRSTPILRKKEMAAYLFQLSLFVACLVTPIPRYSRITGM